MKQDSLLRRKRRKESRGRGGRSREEEEEEGVERKRRKESRGRGGRSREEGALRSMVSAAETLPSAASFTELSSQTLNDC
jgi:hypothetical protein